LTGTAAVRRRLVGGRAAPDDVVPDCAVRGYAVRAHAVQGQKVQTQKVQTQSVQTQPVRGRGSQRGERRWQSGSREPDI